MLSFILFLSIGGAQAAADTTPTEATGEEPSRQQLICRSRPVVGSRIARRLPEFAWRKSRKR